MSPCFSRFSDSVGKGLGLIGLRLIQFRGVRSFGQNLKLRARICYDLWGGEGRGGEGAVSRPLWYCYFVGRSKASNTILSRARFRGCAVL